MHYSQKMLLNYVSCNCHLFIAIILIIMKKKIFQKSKSVHGTMLLKVLCSHIIKKCSVNRLFYEKLGFHLTSL